jgi:DNA-binding transcriptional LysR family regulator
MDKLRALETFIAIADRGSLTKAADALDVSLPTVVRLLAELESHVGARLFNRTTRRIHLTDEGERYLASCRLVMSQLRDAEAALSRAKAQPSGRLRVTSATKFGQMHIAPLVTEYLRSYRDVAVDLLLLDRVVDLVEEGIDVAVRLAPLADSSLVATRVGSVRRVLCASPRYLRANGRPRMPAALREHQLIRFSGTTPGDTWMFNANGKPLAVAVPSRYSTNAIDTALDACRAGLGIGSFLSYQVQSLVKARELEVILAEFEVAPIPVSIIYPHARLLSATVRTFVDLAVQRLRPLDFAALGR